LEVRLKQPAILALEDGSVFSGISIGSQGSTVGEVVFNTAMTGYQEILTDPSYAKQIVTLTYPHIGNVGINSEDKESNKVWAAGLVVRDLPLVFSNWRSEQSLGDYLNENKMVAIAEIDTRRLTRILREKGALNGCIVAGNDISGAEAITKAKIFPGLQGMDLAAEVSTKSIYTWLEGSWDWPEGYKKYSSEQLPWHVVVYDFGVKFSILRMLVDKGCRLTVVPAQTPITKVLELEPDGIFLSNGPGDPAACRYAIEAIQTLSKKEDIPLFGICLGHQLLALGCGAKTIKMKFGHHGANHPVFNLKTKQVFITSQNHGFAVDDKSLPPDLAVMNHSLFDGTLQGIYHTKKPWFGFQGHPEASPGPHDVRTLFNHFLELIQKHSRASYAEAK
jgi:carbamoyl-phosphate synthase small subunit